MGNTTDRSSAYCVVGAGAAGLTAAKNLIQYGIEVDVFERADDVGGTWNYGKPCSAAYNSVHLITSKPYIQYTDFPMPEHYPTYVGWAQAKEYLRSYASHFKVLQRIEFNQGVEWLDRRADSPLWTVTLTGGEQRRYGGVVIANGHNWKPRLPRFPGRFDGLTLHSAQYKTPEVLRNKRVLVVGAGTSACDIAGEAAQNAAATFLSVRRGCYYWPKYLCGVPSDAVYEFGRGSRLPLPVFRAFARLLLRLNSAGHPQRYGLPKPPHRLFDEHFVINSTLLYHLGHGEIRVKPDVAELREDRVLFSDGSAERIDVVVYATGFDPASFAFIDRKHLNWVDRIPRLHLNAFHPVYDNLFVIGYFQTSTGFWPIMDYQSQVMSRYVHLLRVAPHRAAWFRAAKSTPVTGARLNGGLRYYDSERHWLQVEHYTYRNRLKKTIRRLQVDSH